VTGTATGNLTGVTLTTPSVLYSTPINFSVSGGVASGALTLNTQTANKILAGPTSGAAATPTMRSLVAGDIPATLNNSTIPTLTATTINGDSSAGLTINANSSSGTIFGNGNVKFQTGNAVQFSSNTPCQFGGAAVSLNDGSNSGGGTLNLDGGNITHGGTVTATTFVGALTGTASGNAPTTRTISTTAPLTGGGDLSANRTLAMAAATGSVDGYLTAANFATFNNKAPTASPTFTGTVTMPTATVTNLNSDGTNGIVLYNSSTDSASFVAHKLKTNFTDTNNNFATNFMLSNYNGTVENVLFSCVSRDHYTDFYFPMYTRIWAGPHNGQNPSGRLDFYYTQLYFQGGQANFAGVFQMSRTGDATDATHQYDSGTISFQPSFWTGTGADNGVFWITDKCNSGQNNKHRLSIQARNLAGYYGDSFCVQSVNWRTTNISDNIGINNSDPAAHLDIVEDSASRVIIKAASAASQTADFLQFVDSSAATKAKVSKDGIVFLAKTATVPTTDSTGGFLYVDSSGNLKYKGSSGTITQIASA
jgi:hypothetical protein